VGLGTGLNDTEIRSLDRPARREALHRLNYPVLQAEPKLQLFLLHFLLDCFYMFSDFSVWNSSN
jgi:hypothetical protein